LQAARCSPVKPFANNIVRIIRPFMVQRGAANAANGPMVKISMSMLLFTTTMSSGQGKPHRQSAMMKKPVKSESPHAD
jgi:hypothetical protein